MALQEALALAGDRVDPPLGPRPSANGTDVRVEVDQSCGSAGWRCGGYKTVHVVLRIRSLLIAMNIVVTGFTERPRAADLVLEVKPVQIILAVDVVIEVGSGPLAGPPRHEPRHVVAAKAEVEVGGTPRSRTRKRILIPGPPDAPIGRTMRPDGRRCSSTIARHSARCVLIGVAVMAVSALDDRARVKAIRGELGIQVR